ncbi:MAG: outer membrane protein assembly factor BamA [Acidobacteriota bacterium]
MRLRIAKAAVRRTLAALLAVLTIQAPSPLFDVAAEAASQDTVERVEVEGNRQYGREVITHAARLQPGDLIDERRLKKAFDDVFRTGFFEDVTLSIADGTTGKIVVISVVEKPIVRNVEFKGNKSITRSNIDDKLKEASITLPTDAPLDRKKLKSIEDVLRKLADEKGYRMADIRLDLEDVTPGVVKAVFKIDEGSKVRINDVEFKGNDVFGQTRLKYTFKKTREHWWLSWLTSHDIYSEKTFDEDLEKLRDLYLNHGYIDVKIGTPKIETYDYKVTRKGKVKRRINIEIPIEEGDQYDVGAITVEGNKEFESEKLLKMVPLREGHTFSKELLTKGRDAIDEAYGRKGYYKVFTNPRLKPVEGKKVVDVVLEITEDKIFYLRSIEFKGNEATRDKVLRREVLLEEGKVFDTSKFRDSILKINQLGYFQVKDAPEINEVPGSNEVDVVVKGSETGRNEINLGGGYSQSLGFFGTLSFATRNFLGRGETLGISAQTGAKTNTYQLSFAEPWLFDRPLFAASDVYKRKVRYPDFDQESRGGDAILGSRLSNFASWRLRYSLANVDINQRGNTLGIVFNPNPDPQIEDPDAKRRKELFNTSGLTSSITPILIFNTVDNPFESTRGLYMSFSTEYAPKAFGGDFTFVKPQFEGSFFLPVNRFPHVLATHLEIGWVEGLNGKEVPVFERFFLGGERSIRGLEARSVSPTDSSGARIGGNKMILFNQEYVIPIGKSPLKGVLFFDAGNAFDDDQKLDITDLRMTTGVELRITLPVLGQPLRFIYGYNLDPRGDEKKSDFQFTIGSNF